MAEQTQTPTPADPAPPAWFDTLHAAATAVAVVAAVFVAVVAAVTFAVYLQDRARDPLNRPEIVELRKQYAANQKDDALKQKIRDLDLQLRQEFFRNTRQVSAGGHLAIGGLVILLLAVGTMHSVRPRLPTSKPPVDDKAFWATASRSRVSVIVAGIAIVVAIAVAVLFLKTELRHRLPAPPAAPVPATNL